MVNVLDFVLDFVDYCASLTRRVGICTVFYTSYSVVEGSFSWGIDFIYPYPLHFKVVVRDCACT